jgi:hypothetical protein
VVKSSSLGVPCSDGYNLSLPVNCPECPDVPPSDCEVPTGFPRIRFVFGPDSQVGGNWGLSYIDDGFQCEDDGYALPIFQSAIQNAQAFYIAFATSLNLPVRINQNIVDIYVPTYIEEFSDIIQVCGQQVFQACSDNGFFIDVDISVLDCCTGGPCDVPCSEDENFNDLYVEISGFGGFRVVSNIGYLSSVAGTVDILPSENHIQAIGQISNIIISQIGAPSSIELILQSSNNGGTYIYRFRYPSNSNLNLCGTDPFYLIDFDAVGGDPDINPNIAFSRFSCCRSFYLAQNAQNAQNAQTLANKYRKTNWLQ